MSKYNPDFLKGETWGQPGEPVQHMETHAAHVFLCGDQAYKIKKPVALPYLDFSTIEKRRAVIDYELSLNKAFAPTVYIGVISKLGEPVLKMRRFNQQSLLSNIILTKELDELTCEATAQTIAHSHEIAAHSNAKGPSILLELGNQLDAAFAASSQLFPRDEASSFCQQHHAAREALTPLLNVRSAKGLVRRCHGDIHCGNIIIEDHVPVLFDAIEFSEKIATIDVLYDLAFLLMDLIRFNRRQAANAILNYYLNIRREQEDLSGLAAVPIFLATRAGVRALVAADRAKDAEASEKTTAEEEARMYFKSCQSYLAGSAPSLICVGGLSGTGKTTLSRNIAHLLDPAPGAVHVRSDVERKILAGRPEMEHLSPAHYSVSASLAVYTAIMERAEKALGAGRSVILDAVFAKESERHAAESLAGRHNVNFMGVWLETSADTMKHRVSQRRNDASDATADVIDRQLKLSLGKIEWRRIQASGSPRDVSDQLVQILGRGTPQSEPALEMMQSGRR